MPRIRDMGEDALCPGVVAANDEFRSQGVDRRRTRRVRVLCGLLLLIALGVIAGIAFRVQRGGQERDVNAVRLAPLVCLSSISQRRPNPDQFEALCTR
jgi:hypothetical protein